MSETHEGSNQHFIVPHLRKRIDVSSLTPAEWRQNVFSRQSPELRAYSLGALLRTSGFVSANVSCAACLLLSSVSELRGTVLATIVAALNDGLTIPDPSDVHLLIQIARSEPCPLLVPWTLVLRHKLADRTIIDDAVQFLSFRNIDPQLGDDERQLRGVLFKICHRIVNDQEVNMVLF